MPPTWGTDSDSESASLFAVSSNRVFCYEYIVRRRESTDAATRVWERVWFISMKSDARILDAVDTLDDPIHYVRGVVENCFSHGFDRQRAVVRIGVSGKGIIPNYAIEQRSEDTPNFELRLCFH